MIEETTNGISAGDALAVVDRQINILLAYLERPDVLLQVAVLLAIAALSYVLALLFFRVLVRITRPYLRGRSEETRDSVLNRWLPAIDQLDFPLLALLLIYVAVPLVQARGGAVGLLFSSTIFFWVVLAYQVLLTVLYAVFRRKSVRRYHYAILNPTFIGVTLWAVLSFLNINEIFSIQFGQLFDTPITVGSLIGAALVLYGFLAASWVTQDVLRAALGRVDSDPGLVNSILTISRYLVLIFGVIVTLNTLGFSPATLAAVAGGLSLGAGLGLQRIIGNFVSGIVLLVEQSVRPGDVIIVGNDMGVVQKITVRSTIVNRFDNVDLVVPNENLMTSTVTTYNTALARKRVEVRVGVSYGADPTEVRKVLEETAAKHGLVLKDPPPAAYFLDFGDSSLSFVLWAWVDHNDHRWGTQSDLHYMVNHAFSEHGIEIPFPQRDVNLRMPGQQEIATVDAYERSHQRQPTEQLQPSQQGITEENFPSDSADGEV
jgi:potassium-dependent mechanosensitive channel